jgi:two-component system response regulator AtoC
MATATVIRETPAAASAGMEIPETLLFGRSSRMQQVHARLDKVAPTGVPVLIVGESGTGKEVIARYIHSRSLRGTGPFVRVNCPGIPGALLESELFGYEKGAFTGAATSKPGLVESAFEGTLFLDSIAELDLSLQSKLLHFVQDGHFSRIGGHENLHADVRFICAAARPLEEEIQSGRFREDLFHRINVITVNLSPLRERGADIPDLIDFFLLSFANEFRHTPRPIHAAVLQMLAANDWPGNIRQLLNVIKRYVIFDSEEVLLSHDSGDAGVAVNARSQKVSLKQVTREAIRDIERKVILDTLCAYRWNRRKTAEALSISYRALLYKMKQNGLPAKRLAGPESESHKQ